MAKKKRGRIVVLPFNEVLNCDALASYDVTATQMSQVTNRDLYAISMDVSAAYETGAAPAGPVIVGVAHNDYTAEEIEEHLEVADSWDFSNKTDQEKRRRKVRKIGMFDGISTSEKLFDGGTKRIPLKFMLNEGATLKSWCYNASDAALNASFDIRLIGQVYARKA